MTKRGKAGTGRARQQTRRASPSDRGSWMEGRKALIKREQVGTGILCRGQYEEGLAMPKASKGFTSQRMPA